MQPHITIYLCQNFNLDDPYNLSLLALNGMIPLNSSTSHKAGQGPGQGYRPGGDGGHQASLWEVVSAPHEGKFSPADKPGSLLPGSPGGWCALRPP